MDGRDASPAASAITIYPVTTSLGELLNRPTGRARRRPPRAALAILTPFLPGHADHRTTDLAAERNAEQRHRASHDRLCAHRMSVSVPCRAAAGLNATENTVLLSTVPKQAPKAVDRGLLIEQANNDLVVVVQHPRWWWRR